ncbi:MAG: YdiY family protein [Pirellulales bacterium]
MPCWRSFVLMLGMFCTAPAWGQGYFPAPEIPELIGPGSVLNDTEIIPKPDPAETIVFEAAPVEPPPPPPKIWSGSVDAGLNGSEGNSRVFNFRVNASAKRETDATVLNLKLNYVNTANNGNQTVNRVFFDGRNEWKLADSPWSIYIHETTEFDEFRAFDFRVTADAGLAYQFIKNDRTSLSGRFGPGAAREFGGPDNRVTPELVFGGALDHQLTKRQKITLTVDYFPSVLDFIDYRINSQLAWTLLIDEANSLSLKLSLVDRYDSTPQSFKANDLDYAATILWQF